MPDLQSYSVSSALGYTVRWWRIFGWLHNFNSAVECYMEAKTQFTECFCDFAQLSASKTESSNKKMHWNLKPKIATSVTRFYLDLSCGSVWPNAFRLCFAMRFWVSPLLSSLGQRPCCFSVFLWNIRLPSLAYEVCWFNREALRSLRSAWSQMEIKFRIYIGLVESIFRIYSVGVKSVLQGHGSDNSVVCYFLELRSAF